MNHGLTDETVLRIQTTFSHFPEVEKALLYGSRAKGNYKPGSDIDLTLLGAALDQPTLARIADALDNLLLPYRIDLSIFEKITETDILGHIQRVGVTFYEKNSAMPK
jgi:predicted nucleotidyltransferase